MLMLSNRNTNCNPQTCAHVTAQPLLCWQCSLLPHSPLGKSCPLVPALSSCCQGGQLWHIPVLIKWCKRPRLQGWNMLDNNLTGCVLIGKKGRGWLQEPAVHSPWSWTPWSRTNSLWGAGGQDRSPDSLEKLCVIWSVGVVWPASIFWLSPMICVLKRELCLQPFTGSCLLEN